MCEIDEEFGTESFLTIQCFIRVIQEKKTMGGGPFQDLKAMTALCLFSQPGLQDITSLDCASHKAPVKAAVQWFHTSESNK